MFPVAIEITVIIGGEGALLIGALAATSTALALQSMPPLVVQLAMVGAGMIPFVPTQGGQVEIVNDRAMTYTTTEEAVEKIGTVLGSTAQQLQLQAALSTVSGRFGVERFGAEVKALIRDALGRSYG